MLQELVEGYNERYHSGIKRAPTTINKRMICKCGLNNTFPRNQTKYKRSSLNFHQVIWFELVEQESPFARGFGQTYTEELFKVRQRFATIPATYVLEDLNKVQVAGLFYEPEMVLVKGKGRDSEFLVEKILAERTRKGHKQVLIKWKGYPDSFNSQEPASNLV